MKNLQTFPAFIVDDDPFWTAILEQILIGIGITDIHTFEDGVDCLDQIHLNPALIFLDYQMSNSDGLDILQKIKASSPEVEVVFCTALESLEVAIAAMEFGSAEYLLKSTVTDEVVKELVSSFQSNKVA